MSSVDILVPDLPESVADATVATWHKKPGDAVRRDEVLVEIETDKVVLEVPASADGILDAVLEDEGTTVTSRQILGRLREGNSAGKETSAKSEEKDSTPAQRQQASLTEQNNDALSPAIRRLLGEHNLEASAINGTGVGGRITREDVEKHLAKAPAAKAEAKAPAAAPAPQAQLGARGEKRVPMTRLRKRVAERLLEAKNSTAMLTTFNEVNMKPIMDLRKQYGEAFEKRHGIRLGFMLTSLKVVSMAVEFFASSRRSATRLRRRVIGTRFSERWPSCGAGAAAGAAAGALASAGAGAFASCFSTSSRVRRPPTPVPLMAAGSRLCSASRRRIGGPSASLFCSSREGR